MKEKNKEIGFSVVVQQRSETHGVEGQTRKLGKPFITEIISEKYFGSLHQRQRTSLGLSVSSIEPPNNNQNKTHATPGPRPRPHPPVPPLLQILKM